MANESKLSKRETRSRQILGATLRLVRDHGTTVSTAQIAAQANCSKETLYNWFDDRDGIFLALVDEQAKGMNAALTAGFGAATGSFAEKLRTYSTLLLDILTGDAVISVNRIAMSQTCLNSAKFGNAVLANWQEQVRAPFLKLLSEGQRAGEFEIEDVDDAFDTLVGLLIGDRQRRLLLGENARPSSADMTRIADRAVDRFMELFGV
jgi:AcrR family transcriptional regulator